MDDHSNTFLKARGIRLSRLGALYMTRATDALAAGDQARLHLYTERLKAVTREINALTTLIRYETELLES